MRFLYAPKKAIGTESNHLGELDFEDELDPFPVIVSKQVGTSFEVNAISLSKRQTGNTTPEEVGCSA